MKFISCTRFFLSCSVLALIALSAAGCSTRGVREPQLSSAEIAPADILEVCLQLAPGQVLNYFFESSVALTFEILYYENEPVASYSVSDISSEAGSFYPAKPEFYCMRWANSGTAAAAIEYRYDVEKGSQ